jgi:hypothetical protein
LLGSGQGCDSGNDSPWQATPSQPLVNEPSCVPQPDGSGPYRSSPVPWVPTIMDRMIQGGLGFRIYRGDGNVPYGWSACPSFADCLYSQEGRSLVTEDLLPFDAASGHLPPLSFVVPPADQSGAVGTSMAAADAFLGQTLTAIMNGPEWGSTAVFVTAADCGCFYDHVAPPPGMGVRMPMVIVSPYARAGSTDSTVASFESILAFTEHTFGLTPLGLPDASAYDLSGAFDFSQAPLPPITLP